MDCTLIVIKFETKKGKYVYNCEVYKYETAGDLKTPTCKTKYKNSYMEAIEDGIEEIAKIRIQDVISKR